MSDRACTHQFLPSKNTNSASRSKARAIERDEKKCKYMTKFIRPRELSVLEADYNNHMKSQCCALEKNNTSR